MNKTVTVFDFSGIYEHESFYRSDKGSCFCDENKGEGLKIRFLDMKDISGTNCMCDDAAISRIKEKITEASGTAAGEKEASADFDSFLNSLHFIDSGNYHYMSYILLSMIKEPFSLVVFDHHPDMQPPMFGNILSCGGWVQKVIEDNAYVRDVHIIGADRELISKLDEDNVKRVSFYDIEDVRRVGLPKTEYPVYLSVDKDVVRRDELITNWDQGDMGAEELLSYIGEFIGDPARKLTGVPNRKLIGIDVCGECAPDQEGIDVDTSIKGNDEFNAKVIALFTK